MPKSRSTGRTGRMMREAIRLAEAGQDVVVVVAGAKQAHDLFVEYDLITMPLVHLTTEAVANRDIDWMSMRMKRTGMVLLVDHYVLERRYPKILEMLHRFDAVDDPAEIRATLNDLHDELEGRDDG